MDKEKIINFMQSKRGIYAICIFTLISSFLFIFALALLIKENSQCVNDPFVYSAKRIKTNNPSDELIAPLCSCSGANWEFYFDSEGMYSKSPYTTESYTDNIGNLNLGNFSISKT